MQMLITLMEFDSAIALKFHSQMQRSHCHSAGDFCLLSILFVVLKFLVTSHSKSGSIATLYVVHVLLVGNYGLYNRST